MLCHRLGSGDRTAGDTPLNLVWDVLASSEMCVLPLCLRDHCHVSFASQTAAVSQHGTVRDRTLPIVALHTGLRAEELCRLKREHVHLGRRSAHVSIYGKRNKFREVPLNSTARNALASYMQSLPSESAYLSPSRKRGESDGHVSPVGERALVYIVSKYAERARVRDLSPHVQPQS